MHLFSPTRTLPHFLILAIILGLLEACGAPSRLSSVNAGKTTAYAPGVPNFDIEAVSIRQNQQSGINLHIAVPYTSLVFEKDSSSFQASYEFSVEVRKADSEQLLHTDAWTDSIQVESHEKTQKYEPLRTTKRLDVAPGRYTVRVRLQDLHNKSQAVRLQQVDVPDASSPALSSVYMETKKEGGSFQPAIALHIPSDTDSLQAVTELYKAQAAKQIEVGFKLLRFESDRTVAQPPDALTPMAGSLEYRGTDYGEADTVRTLDYTVGGSGDSTLIAFAQPALDPGIYRVTVTAALHYAQDSTQVLEGQRTFSVKGPGFPRITSLEEMVQALAYIGRESELEKIQEEPTPSERRKAFDAFWAQRTNSKKEAANLIESYYSRVEEANRFFTGHKEGWKTDRGMLYIVYGPPLEVNRYVDTEIWYYDYSETDPRDRYVFERGRHYDKRGPMFQNFLLQRRPYYYRRWERAVHRWREGNVPRGGR